MPGADDSGSAHDAERFSRDPQNLDLLAAVQGDRKAAGRYFEEHLSLLMGISRKVAGSTYDPDDLLSEAILNLLDQWERGRGPSEQIIAYLAQSMRNRVRDFARSPRSKVVEAVEDFDFVAPADPRIRELEISSDLDIVRRALAKMPEDQRKLLIATVVEERKPGELEELLGRPAPAIYSLNSRAKLKLRKLILETILLEDAPEECRKAARRLPKQVPLHLAELPVEKRTAHFRECARCKAGWGRFGYLSALGLSTFLVLADLSAGPSSGAQASTPQTGTAPHSGGSAGSNNGLLSGPKRMSNWARSTMGSRSYVILFSAVLVLGLAALAVVVSAYATNTLWFAAPPKASFETALDSVDGETNFNVQFDVPGEEWTVDRFTLQFSSPIASLTPPDHWDCEFEGALGVCTTSLPSAEGGHFGVALTAPREPFTYQLSFTARTLSGFDVSGTASGRQQVFE
ncbi:sigma-70 family RNA polymerase sigma factor [Leucobacter viscericola]|uniref:Sigma-70 family RNA polymerase sigma factor n=1 Tax=Leucobacter viscericola TaxID=2714935 RepID=A0A6G7XGD2_9MICO|nr:sigma-70 family RNA polymerase sigma factor [Leucobacter viscericola]QIK63431.1 sigma-70 family RNA polymerase sigma factor [Leucobacter viscericola]